LGDETEHPSLNQLAVAVAEEHRDGLALLLGRLGRRRTGDIQLLESSESRLSDLRGRVEEWKARKVGFGSAKGPDRGQAVFRFRRFVKWMSRRNKTRDICT
jgi:hypothetical protein